MDGMQQTMAAMSVLDNDIKVKMNPLQMRKVFTSTMSTISTSCRCLLRNTCCFLALHLEIISSRPVRSSRTCRLRSHRFSIVFSSLMTPAPPQGAEYNDENINHVCRALVRSTASMLSVVVDERSCTAALSTVITEYLHCYKRA